MKGNRKGAKGERHRAAFKLENKKPAGACTLRALKN
jgi:hypothetical protein